MMGSTSTTTQAPWVNFVVVMTTMTTKVVTAPLPLMTALSPQCRLRSFSQWRTMPVWESVKPRKTPSA